MNPIPVLAVDAGATNCRAVLCNEQGEVLGYAHGGACNYQSVGIDSVRETLTSVLSSLVSKDSSLCVQCAVFGLAGLDTENDRVVLEQVVQQALESSKIQADRVLLDNDGMMTLLGAVGHGPGVLVVSGTGSIACGVRDDKLARAGGWGHRVGDEGSGYSIGKAAVIHVLHAYDGREKSSQITKPILAELSLKNEEDLIAWIYGPEFSVDRVAALTPLLCELAENGDWKAISILQKASEELAKAAMAVINRLSLQQEPFDLVLMGGVLSQNSTIREQVIRIIKKECPNVQIISPKYEPVCGGVLRGLMELGISDTKVLERLAKEISVSTVKMKEDGAVVQHRSFITSYWYPD
ncbi:N-acetylglucosamine kinase [Effusibacillus lacus]|uniref:N-acetylglucosamine kinase n=1 Tax=Effusibacillus lacus TaxID=1348429 RepID=A0A292YI69_9BACL|nr:BadF/BadG/BcrA/BcrD ATPase family protein [Effusibacillus lacus]TCS71094.1 N-acetylglucosamine kinase-like BadF-type ATPase [Effusibacillus lacus]GAX90737.1 N-acetylglucosamine kinase [Effusibacillus lacus]